MGALLRKKVFRYNLKNYERRCNTKIKRERQRMGSGVFLSRVDEDEGSPLQNGANGSKQFELENREISGSLPGLPCPDPLSLQR